MRMQLFGGAFQVPYLRAGIWLRPFVSEMCRDGGPRVVEGIGAEASFHWIRIDVANTVFQIFYVFTLSDFVRVARKDFGPAIFVGVPHRVHLLKFQEAFFNSFCNPIHNNVNVVVHNAISHNLDARLSAEHKGKDEDNLIEVFFVQKKIGTRSFGADVIVLSIHSLKFDVKYNEKYPCISVLNVYLKIKTIMPCPIGNPIRPESGAL